MSNLIPTIEQLQPLYDAALAYGKASVHTSEVYKKAQHKLTKTVCEANRVQNTYYRTVCAQLDALNAQFPGLLLANPAPWVGWTADLEAYQHYVKSRLPAYILELWTKRHETEIQYVRQALRNIPLTDAFGVGSVICHEADLFRVEKITPKRRIIVAMSLSTGKMYQLSGPHKQIDLSLATKLLAMRKSRLQLLKANGLKVIP